MKNKLKPVVLLVLFVTINCTNDSESDFLLTQDPVSESVGEPEEEITISFTNSVAPIISNNCLGCHSNPTRNGAPFPLVTFNDVNNRSGAVLRAISKQTGEPSAMPPSGRIPQANIDIINQWIEEGKIQ